MNANFELDPAQWATLRGLLDSALALAPEQRSTWVEQLAPEHAALKDRLRSLLAHAARGTGASPLDTLPKIETAQFLAGRGPDDAEKAGDPVGPYRLVRPLGEGGMGTVWLAERTDMLQKRAVALKLPRASWRGARLAQRLAREREILAPLNHPNIARLYEAGIAADGQPYLALEYVEGEPIDAYCARKQLDVPARLRLFLQVARAVAHAHANLVVHRDLKPTNILVTEAGEVKLLDFGIAKLLEDGAARETELTQLGGRALTPDYAAPEQILGQPIATAADVYSLGVVLYELLTGARPYKLKRDSRAALEEAIVQAEPPAPSAAVADRRRARRLRGDLDTIVAKSLKKRPADRYGTVQALAEDVERHLDGRAVQAQPDSTFYRVRKFVARNRLAVAAGSSVVLAVVAGAGVAVWQARVANEQRDTAVREKQRAEEVKAFMLNLFRDAGPQNRAGRVLTTIELLKLARERVDQLDPGRVELRVELLGTLGDSLLMLEDAKAAEAVLGQAIAEASARLDAGHKLVLWAKSMLAQSYRRQGRQKEMRAVLEEIVPVLRARQAEFPNQLLAALVNLVNLSCAEYRFDECRKAVDEGLRVAAERFGGRHVNGILLLARRAQLLAHAGDLQGAIEVASQAVALALSLHANNPQHAMVLFARFALAKAHAEDRRYDTALAQFDQVLADTERIYGGRTRQYALRALEVAPHVLHAGDPQRAVAMTDEALQILARAQDPDSLVLPGAQSGRGLVLLGARKLEPAAQALASAVGGFAGALPPDHPWLGAVQHDHALALAYQGRVDAALATIATAAAPSPGFAPDLAARSTLVRAIVLRLADQPAKAGEAIAQAQERFRAAGIAVPAAYGTRLELEAQLARVEAGQPPGAAADHAGLATDRPVGLPERADLLLAAARVLLAGGDAVRALPLLQKVDAFWSAYDPRSRWSGEAAFWLARAHAQLGHAADARQAHARAAKILVHSPVASDARMQRLATDALRERTVAAR